MSNANKKSKRRKKETA